MKKFFVITSGIYITILAIIACLSGIASFFISYKQAEVAPSGINPIFGSFVMLACAIWLLATGLGIFMRKNWSRYSLFAMSAFAIFGGIITSLIAAFLPQLGPEAEAIKNMSYIKLGIIGFNLIFFVLLPIIFLIFFNTKSVIDMFAKKENIQEKTGRPVGVMVVAIFSLLGAVFFATQTIFLQTRVPIIANFFLPDIFMRAYSLVLAVVYSYITYGLFKMKKAAWVAYVICSIYSIAIGLINIFTMSQSTYNKIMEGIPGGYNTPITVYKIMGSLSFLLPLVMLIYIIMQKKLFFNPSKDNLNLENTQIADTQDTS